MTKIFGIQLFHIRDIGHFDPGPQKLGNQLMMIDSTIVPGIWLATSPTKEHDFCESFRTYRNRKTKGKKYGQKIFGFH
jgi:hypothetical protein